MSRRLLTSIAALALATSVEAVDVLKVMKTGDACPAGGMFQTFGDPGINSQADVLFWSQSSLGVNGLYLDPADVPGAQVLVTEGQYLEPLGTVFRIRPQRLALNAVGHTAFVCSTSNGNAVAYAGLSDVSLVAAADSDEPTHVSGSAGTAFSDAYETQWCNDAGDVTYQRSFAMSVSDYPLLIGMEDYDGLDWMPYVKRGTSVEQFWTFAYDSLWCNAASAMRISNTGAFIIAKTDFFGHSQLYFSDRSTSVPFPSRIFPVPSGGAFASISLNDSDEAAYLYESSEGSHVIVIDWSTWSSWVSVSSSTPLRTGDPAPGGVQWDRIESVALNNAGRMAFSATCTDGSAGVYAVTVTTASPVHPDSVTTLATTGQLAPDSGDVYFTGFGAAAINSNGDVAFRADLSGGESGIYIASDNDLSFTAYCPVDIILTAPDGSVCSRDMNEIPRARYLEDDFDGDGEATADKRVVIVGPRAGEYSIDIVPQADTGIYSLLVEQTELGSVLLRDDAAVAAERICHILPDDVPPITRHRLAGLAGSAGWLISPVQVALSAVDPAPGSGVAAIRYTLDNQAEAVYEEPFTVSADGVHSLSFQATDGTGNAEEPVVVTMAIDQTAPLVRVEPEIQQVWPDVDGIATAEITAFATDNICTDLSYMWLAQGDALGQSPHVVLTFDTPGIYTIDLVVTDDAGHEAVDQATVAVGSTVPAALELEPHALSGPGQSWLTAYVQLRPELAQCEDIVATTVRLNGAVSPVLDSKFGFTRNAESHCIDRNGDEVTERILKFERSDVLQTLPTLGGLVTLTGDLITGSDFIGTDSVKVVDGYYGSIGGPSAKPVAESATYYLASAHPNPFNAETQIAFGLAEAQRAQLVVCDVLGRRVRVIVDADMPAGQHTARWDGMNESGRTVATGVYFCRLQAGSFRSVKRMLLLR